MAYTAERIQAGLYGKIIPKVARQSAHSRAFKVCLNEIYGAGVW